jgi:hypothetical protein
MSQDNPGILHDATNSWNGYNHQGKIALYFAVKKITELIQAGADQKTNQAVLATHFLEVEYTEDFSIGTIGAGGELRYQTIHQVKDRKDTTLNSYKSAIQGLAVNMVRHPEIEAAYLHTTKKVSDEKDKAFEESVRDMIKDTSWIPEQKIKAEAKRDQKKRQEELDWLAKVENDLPGIWQDAQKLGKIQKYSYETEGKDPKYFCTKEEAREYLQKSLRGFYDKHDPDRDYKQSSEFIDKSYQYLLEQLNEHVVFRSKHYSDKKVQRHIPLSDLYSWLISDEIENMGEEYYLYQIKEGYLNYVEHFCSICVRSCCETCPTDNFMMWFRCMKPRELKDFFLQTNPNVPGSIDIGQYPKFLQESGIRNPFWEGLRRNTQKPEELQAHNDVRYLGKDSRTYILTTLTANIPDEEDDDDVFVQEEAEREVNMICTEIYKNQNELERDLGGKCLISKNIDVESVRERALTINPSDIFSDSRSIAVSTAISIVPGKIFRKKYMRKEQEEA